MRTTVTLDPDVVALLRKAVRTRDISFKEALNSAVRAGLASNRAKQPRYRLHSAGMVRSRSFRNSDGWF